MVVLVVSLIFLNKIYVENTSNLVFAKITQIERKSFWSPTTAKYNIYVEYEFGYVIYNDIRIDGYSSGMIEGGIITGYVNANRPNRLILLSSDLILIIGIKLVPMSRTV